MEKYTTSQQTKIVWTKDAEKLMKMLEYGDFSYNEQLTQTIHNLVGKCVSSRFQAILEMEKIFPEYVFAEIIGSESREYMLRGRTNRGDLMIIVKFAEGMKYRSISILKNERGL